MKIQDLLAANALIKLSPFFVVGGVLIGVVAYKDWADQVDIKKAEAAASSPASIGMATCAQAAARYNKDQWKSLWDTQEVLCKEAQSPGTFSKECLAIASNYVLGKTKMGDDFDINCFGGSESDLIKARCLSGQFHLSEWKGANCNKLTGMTYMEFMEK